MSAFLTIEEVAKEMKVSKMTVYRLVHSGNLRSSKIGKNFRVREIWLAEYLQSVTSGGDK